MRGALDHPPEGPGGASRCYLLVFEQGYWWVFQLRRTGHVVIGSAETAELRLRGAAVAAKHALFTMSDGKVQIADLGTSGGTWVNGERLDQARPLASGDIMTVGGAMLVYYAAASGQALRSILDFAQLRERAAEELERAVRFQRPLTFLVMDLGGQMVDRKAVTALLNGTLRLIDIIAWSDEHQLIVLMPETSAEVAPVVAERLLRVLLPIAPGVRSGFASCPADGCDFPALLANARLAAQEAEIGGVSSQRRVRTVLIGGKEVIVGDVAMTRLYTLIERIAAADLPVLICGETGVGKELAAAAVHHWSPRRTKPMVTLNCAALQETLLESELFGYEKGAFTGAVGAKPGLLETAQGGTVCLDEVGELPPLAQAKLLRVLETKRVTRLGDLHEREIDVRIVAATNRNLDEEVKAGRFRRDLFFRLSGARLWIPPLRERTAELAVLAQRFLDDACNRGNRAPMTIGDAAMEVLRRYSWPGNVRELRNVMEYLAAASPDPAVEQRHLAGLISMVGFEDVEPAQGRPAKGPQPLLAVGATPAFRPLDEEIRELEQRRMVEALGASGGNQTKAAELIGMPRRTFVAKLKEYQLGGRDRPEPLLK